MHSTSRRTGVPRRRAEAGFTYLAVLLAVALLGTLLAQVGEVWHTTVQRDKEQQLLFAGEAFKRALSAYYDNTPGGVAKQFPATLEDLLRDARYPQPRRYLRRIYLDPMTGRAEWGLIKLGDRVIGVHSLSAAQPFRHGEVPVVDADSGNRRAPRYSDWQFLAEAPPDTVAVLQNDLTVTVDSNEVSPPPTAPPVRRLPPSTDRCERLQAADAQTCANSAQRNGSDPECAASAARRYSNCSAGVNIGPLWLRTQ